MTISVPPRVKRAVPATCQRIAAKVTAVTKALSSPIANSTRGSMARRTSSAMRYSGALCSRATNCIR
jgi:hypothetical protein